MKNKRFLILILMVGVTITLTFSSAIAEEFKLLGRPLQLFGYATQGGSFSLLDKDKYDVEKGFNSALTNLFVEGDYAITDNLKFYGSSMVTVDWMYQLKHNGSSWHDKLFSESKHNLNVDDKYWMLLKEARLTWTPGNFMFRVGKQIVSWGELLAFRIMDQINPLDQRRGFADVEFETTIIPIWLIRADYYPKMNLGWLQDLGFEFVWNPNADFIPNQGIKAGNDEGGIWAPNVQLPGPPPFFESHLGSTFDDISTPKRWKEGNEFGFRVKGNMFGALMTLNAFYGRDNNPAMLPKLIPPVFTLASDGRFLIHPFQEGKYPLFKFVGATFSKEITPLRAGFLGGVAPTVYVEALYASNSTFTFSDPITGMARFDKSDDFQSGIEVSWKVKIPVLNPTTYFGISPGFNYRRIMDYPSIETIGGLKKNNYATVLSINTQYFHGKLTPSAVWVHDINSKSDYYRLQLAYDYSNKWHFTLGSQLFHGEKRNQGMQVFDNKDQIYFKISYKWG